MNEVLSYRDKLLRCASKAGKEAHIVILQKLESVANYCWELNGPNHYLALLPDQAKWWSNLTR